MFEVRGYVKGVPYVLRADAEHTGPDGVVIACAPRTALNMLAVHEGERVMATATGPVVVVSLKDTRGVLAGLYAFTEVTSVHGDPPQLAPSSPESSTDGGQGRVLLTS